MNRSSRHGEDLLSEDVLTNLEHYYEKNRSSTSSIALQPNDIICTTDVCRLVQDNLKKYLVYLQYLENSLEDIDNEERYISLAILSSVQLNRLYGFLESVQYFAPEYLSSENKFAINNILNKYNSIHRKLNNRLILVNSEKKNYWYVIITDQKGDVYCYFVPEEVLKSDVRINFSQEKHFINQKTWQTFRNWNQYLIPLNGSQYRSNRATHSTMGIINIIVTK